VRVTDENCWGTSWKLRLTSQNADQAEIHSRTQERLIKRVGKRERSEGVFAFVGQAENARGGRRNWRISQREFHGAGTFVRKFVRVPK